MDVNSNLTLELFKKLCADKDFPKDQIAGIIRETNKDNLAFAEKLCNKKEFPKEFIPQIINAVSAENLPFAEKICADIDYL